MSLTQAQARDEILVLFKAAWDGTGVDAYYDDADKDAPDALLEASNAVDSFARVMVRNQARTLRALGQTGGTRRKYTSEGQVVVQIFTPRGDGLTSADALSTTARNAFEGETTDGGVWFANVSVREVGPSGTWYQTNVSADFSYDEVR